MQIDRTFLAQHASHMTGGVVERALTIDVANESCFALLSTHESVAAKDPGFVVCHSFGIEFLTYRRTERQIARTLAASGHPVLAIHCRGYGDSTGSLADVTVDSHVEDISAGADALRAATGVRSIGLIGAGFGGLIAGLVARTQSVDRLLLMNPAPSGASYFREMFREKRIVHLANKDENGSDPLETLRRDGMVDVLGYPVYRRLYEQSAGEDLRSGLGSFAGSALIVHVAKRPSIPRSLHAVRDGIEAAGGSCRIEHVGEPPGTTFGGPAFVAGSDPTVRIDGQEPIVERISEMAMEWMA